MQGVIKPGRIGVGVKFNPVRGDTPLHTLRAEEAIKEALKIVFPESEGAEHAAIRYIPSATRPTAQMGERPEDEIRLEATLAAFKAAHKATHEAISALETEAKE